MATTNQAYTTKQEYIDILYKIQCCLGNLVNQVAQQQYIGFDCKELKDKVKLLYAIKFALLQQDITLTDEQACLSEQEINSLIDKSKLICKNCCFEHVERPI